MDGYLEYLKNPLVAGPLAGLLIVFLAFLDNKINDRNFEKGYYIKLFFSVGLLTATLIYFAKSGSLIQKGGQLQAQVEDVIVKKLGSTGLDIYTDAPDF